MARRPRPSVIEKIQAKQAAEAPQFTLDDLGNLVFAARRSVGAIGGQDMINVASSIARAEVVLEAARAAQKAAADAKAAQDAAATAAASAARGPHLAPDAPAASPSPARAAPTAKSAEGT